MVLKKNAQHITESAQAPSLETSLATGTPKAVNFHFAAVNKPSKICVNHTTTLQYNTQSAGLRISAIATVIQYPKYIKAGGESRALHIGSYGISCIALGPKATNTASIEREHNMSIDPIVLSLR